MSAISDWDQKEVKWRKKLHIIDPDSSTGSLK